MKHYLYCSAGNTEGLDEYIAFFEIAEDGCCARYIEIPSVGYALKYTEDEPADEFGVLPEGPWDALEAAKPKYGTLNEISQQLLTVLGMVFVPVDIPLRVGCCRTMNGRDRPEAVRRSPPEN